MLGILGFSHNETIKIKDIYFFARDLKQKINIAKFTWA